MSGIAHVVDVVVLAVMFLIVGGVVLEIVVSGVGWYW